MKAVAAAVFAAGWLASGGRTIHAQESAFEVRLRFQVDRSITPRRFRGVRAGVLEDEAAAIWRPYGVQLEWTDTREHDERMDGFYLDVRLEPQLDRLGRAPWGTVLGSASVQPGAPTRSPILVSLDGTEAFLALGKARRPPAERLVRDVDLARGLGRILAHEVGHVLLAAPRHADAGLMRASFGVELGQLDREPFRLTCADVDRLRTRLRALASDPRFAQSARHRAEDDGEPASCIVARRSR